MNGAVIVPPGEGTRYGNVEFLARTADTPRFTFGIISSRPAARWSRTSTPTRTTRSTSSTARSTFALGEQGDEVVAGPGTFVLVPPGVAPRLQQPHRRSVVRILNLHAPAGFDLRIAADD